MKKYNKNGFTLIELLIVITIIMVLIGLLMPALYGTKKQAKNKQAKAESLAIITAIIAYHADTRTWPVPNGHQNSDDRDYGADSNDKGGNNGSIIKILVKAAPPYLSLGDFKADSSGNLLDPWGEQYIIKIDNNYDEDLAPDLYNKDWLSTARSTIVVWSAGADKARGKYHKIASNDTEVQENLEIQDNVISWR